MAFSPVSCFTCGKVISGLYQTYLDLCTRMTEKEAMDKLNLKRYCCRRMVFTNVDVTDLLLMYQATHNTDQDNPHIVEKPRGNVPQTYIAR
jgi:DNA-directed RNA polymerase I, II, and III subunit RPABC5